MIGLESKGPSKCCIPLRESLARQAEHQIDVHIPEARVAQKLKGRFRLARRMFAPEQLKEPVIERLHPKADPADPKFSQQRCFPLRNTSWIGFESPLA